MILIKLFFSDIFIIFLFFEKLISGRNLLPSAYYKFKPLMATTKRFRNIPTKVKCNLLASIVTYVI